MALRVWLPLNGTLENKGIEGVQPTAGSTTINWNNNGKIGKCFEPTGADTSFISFIAPSLANKKVFSIAFWLYPDSTSVSKRDWATILRLMTGSGTLFFCTGSATSATTSVIIANNENDIWTGVNPATSPNTVNQWNHITVVADGSKVHFYNNGVEFAVRTQSTGHITGDIRLVNAMTGKMNDLRIYDHALSPKEVKEISQGLVLHYKLDGWSGGVGENLVEGSNTNTTSTNKWFGHSAVGGNTSTIEQDETGVYCVKVTRDTTEQSSWDYLSYDNLLRNNIKTNTKYTISFDCKPSVTGSIGFTGFVNGNATNYMTNSTTVIQGNCTANKWNHMVYQCTTISSFDNITVGGQVVYFSRSTSLKGTNVTVLFKNIKVEEGSIETSWSPTSSEMGIDTTKVTDSSGYGNDGTVTGTLSTESDSNRYEISTHYSGSSYTDTGSGTFNWFDFSQCTLSAWIKPTTSVSSWSGSIGVQHNQNAGHKGFTITDYANNFRVVTVNGSYTTIDSGKPLTVGEWHHCAAVLDGTNLKMYYDGAMVKESTVSWGSVAIATDMRFATGVDFPGGDEMFTGNYSDVRMYCTALSAEDILDLYHTSMNIDDMNVLHSFELAEQSGNMFAGSPMTGTVTWDDTNNYYTITSNPSTSNWGIGPAVGTLPKKIIPWGMSYILTYEVYSPTAAQWYIDYNNNDPTVSLSGNDNDNGRLRTGVNVPANTWTLITYGCSNTNETKNPDHLPLYDSSTGLGPVMSNISSAITWHMRNPQWYLVDADNKEHIYESGVFQANFLKEDSQSSYTSFRNEEKAVWAHEFVEK